MDGDWFFHVLVCGNINSAADWILSSCLENVLAYYSYHRNSCSLFLVVSLDILRPFGSSAPETGCCGMQPFEVKRLFLLYIYVLE
jgi:hypothetical protein